MIIPYIQKEVYMGLYYFSKNKKYLGRLRKCLDCGIEEIVRKSNKSQYCKICSQRHKKSCVRDDEVFVQRGLRRRQRGKILKCEKCGKERFVRSDAKYKTNLCSSCSSSLTFKRVGKVTGKLRKTFGQNIYRNIAYKIVEKKCLICFSRKKVVVHHIDGNRLNNDISNLFPACRSCHFTLHKYYEKGKTHTQAFGLIRMRLKLKNNTGSSGEYKKE